MPKKRKINPNNLDEVNEKIKELKAKKKSLIKEIEHKTKWEERKKRAHRLIETGAMCEKYFKMEKIPLEEREELFKMFAPFIVANTPKKFKKYQDDE